MRLGRELPPLGNRPRGSRAGVVPLHPTPRHRARGCSNDMRLGRVFTAVAQQVPRLAGLVRLPASWQVHTAIRRQASWLATKASVNSNSRWPFALQKYTSCIETSQPARGAYAHRQLREKNISPFIHAAKPSGHNEASQPARGALASRQLRGSRAAIGSGGKKARPF